jgi:hypothetical protein
VQLHGAEESTEPVEEPGESSGATATRGCWNWKDDGWRVVMAARRARKPTMPVLRCTGGGVELFEFWDWEWEVLLTMNDSVGCSP